MSLAIVPAPKTQKPPDLDSHILAMFLLWARAPRKAEPEIDGSYSLGEIGDAPEKTWTKATPYSLARTKIMRTVERRTWVEEVGEKVILLRLPGMDITLAFWKFWPRIGIYLHDGVPASYRWPTGEHDVIVRRTGKPDTTPPPTPVEFGAEMSPWIQ